MQDKPASHDGDGAPGRIVDSLKGKGGHLIAPPEGFIVKGNEGPLKQGELERAAQFLFAYNIIYL
ncbi:MAG: hypothetical protein M5U10_11355 [Candidatus Methanoperedens sp.]|uniref:hypothetical protein n=1 Tax=Candidatus Methanoperedens nitratireducens TaxID=1392998 RepID=UPI00064FA0FF|nr:hypothetical protein [Candidatus Methanoperedens nitroreducens]MDJ1422499.1 hypothetical protein [Candidatus Methanoperedens sp.]